MLNAANYQWESLEDYTQYEERLRRYDSNRSDETRNMFEYIGLDVFSAPGGAFHVSHLT